MSSAKDIIVKPIKAAAANAIIKKIHYNGKVVQNSQLHLGVFLNGKLEGAMQFGPSIDKRKTQALVSDSGWNDFIELNRMAFSDALPRLSESRALGVAIRMIKKQYPHIKWIISFSDGAQCGDGAIYRASGFCLTAIKKNTTMLKLNDGSVIASKSLHHDTSKNAQWLKDNGARPLDGFQLRYIYFIDKSCKEKLTSPIIPFSEIDKKGAGMYKGERVTLQSRRVTKANPDDQLGCGGAIPTSALQSKNTEQQGKVCHD